MAFDESKHPRAEDGKFTSKDSAGASTGGKDTKESKSEKKAYKKGTIGKYKDYGIDYDVYGSGEFTVQYNGDDMFFDTEEEARAFIDDITGGDEKVEENEEFDDNSYRASFIVDHIEDLVLSDKDMSKALTILKTDRATEFENIIKENLDIGDNPEEAVVNALENYKEESQAPKNNIQKGQVFTNQNGDQIKIGTSDRNGKFYYMVGQEMRVGTPDEINNLIQDGGYKNKNNTNQYIDADYERAYGEAPDPEENPSQYQKYIDEYKEWKKNGESTPSSKKESKDKDDERKKASKLFGLPF